MVAFVEIFSVSGKNSMESGEEARFPVDEGAVAIEGENLEAGEIEHGTRIRAER